MNVLLVSGYELGHQPYHLAVPAADLLADGHEVRCLDLSVEEGRTEDLEWADALGISVPMHTAARLGVEFALSTRSGFPDLPVVFYGLYAHVAWEAFRSRPSWGIGGEYRQALRGLVSRVGEGGEGRGRLGGPERACEQEADSAPATGVEGTRGGLLSQGSVLGQAVEVRLDRTAPVVPARRLLPGLDSYAKLAWGGELKLAGYVEATSGCSHKCRHCPVPIVYEGRIRKAGLEAILEDVAQLRDAGARHISFGDPDFLNAPSFAQALVAEFHASFPDLTFDCTAKVEHIIRHSDLWEGFAKRGLVFVVSAFETTNARVLEVLDKGHRPEDFPIAVSILRQAGVEPRPSFLPFTPWTRPEDLREILQVCSDLDLVANVDPVQFSLKLLVPKGSLLLNTDAMRARLGPYDERALSYLWEAVYPETVGLQTAVAHVVQELSAGGEAAHDLVMEAVARAAFRAAPDCDVSESEFVEKVVSAADPRKVEARPRLTESWYCCAEPTSAQLQTACSLNSACA